MNNDFPRIITFLRKERGLSQKQVASDLGVSQALLSHYEKGIRECGLDFLIKTAEYYDVSTDFLLGRTVQRKPSTVTAADLLDAAEVGHSHGSLLGQIGEKHLTNTVSNYLMCAEYQMFRTIYCADKNNTQTMFALDRNRYKNLTAASMLVDMERMEGIIEREKISLSLSPDIISSYFDKGASSLFNLIQFSERNVRNIAGRNE